MCLGNGNSTKIPSDQLAISRILFFSSSVAIFSGNRYIVKLIPALSAALPFNSTNFLNSGSSPTKTAPRESSKPLSDISFFNSVRTSSAIFLPSIIIYQIYQNKILKAKETARAVNPRGPRIKKTAIAVVLPHLVIINKFHRRYSMSEEEEVHGELRYISSNS